MLMIMIYQILSDQGNSQPFGKNIHLPLYPHIHLIWEPFLLPKRVFATELSIITTGVSF